MYDIIGDIHGHGKKLVELLEKLGYQKSETGYRHESRKVIFVGDFVDRGEHLRQHRLVLNTVMAMVRSGNALAVMGNHEFNALSYHTVVNGKPLRAHTAKNQKQHQAFLNEYSDDPEALDEVLSFFYSLPLWLELDGLRVVHATWCDDVIEFLNAYLPGGRLSQSSLIEANRKGSDLYEAIETTLKGQEAALPEGVSFSDKDGNERSDIRVRWWDDRCQTFGDAKLPESLDIGHANDLALPVPLKGYKPSSVPCFIGHYWRQGKLSPLASNVACVDYSVAKGGHLTAYRWSGEQALQEKNFVSA